MDLRPVILREILLSVPVFALCGAGLYCAWRCCTGILAGDWAALAWLVGFWLCVALTGGYNVLLDLRRR